MQTSELDFDFDEALIAQAPLADRDAARLLVVDRAGGRIAHRKVRDLPKLLPPSLFIVNNTRVIPARLLGQKPSGGRVELLLLEPLMKKSDTEERWLTMGKASKGLRQGSEVIFAEGALRAEVLWKRNDGRLEVVLRAEGGVAAAIQAFGAMPLPPYIRRAAAPEDRERYQTIFAASAGAVAAPTAGLHFSKRLVGEMAEEGHRLAPVTLHVGAGTFAPVREADLTKHRMHAEHYEVLPETAMDLQLAKAEGRPVVAVGTTALRTLESAGEDGAVVAERKSTSLFIYPPFRFRIADGLMTNFHLPRSTLLALVMAFGGIELIREAYRQAVAERYRFFSYGDAMLIADGVLT
ncbi:MAG: tRNA preQ1(34) S-adenosylmethionine ribosyltransferase-isomerase QueA [Myxococcota bacterium]